MYQNGTVMVQGSEATLSSFVQDFPTLRKIAETKKDKDNTPTSPLTSGTPTAGAQAQTHTTGLFTELLQDQINQCRTQLKNSVQEMRESLTTPLEEVKATMRRELVQGKEEMAKELSVIKSVLQHREQTVETPREKLQPLTTPNTPTDPPSPTTPPHTDHPLPCLPPNTPPHTPPCTPPNNHPRASA
ncbi:unnamed protein product [Coregonus sp. 'balchen']|nr:unnamed protein product [Coregonus sp. 'balchen']